MKTLPIRPFSIALVVTLGVWGVCLSPLVTLSPESQILTVRPDCRAAGSDLACSTYTRGGQMEDAGAPAWVSIPADYFFRRVRLSGQPRPHWNPYTGSGFPIALDGHTSEFSPTQWFYSRVPGDQGRDIVTFTRFLLWTFGITWLVSLCAAQGSSTLLLVVVAVAATLAPYGAAYVDIVFLDADLLSPWFLLILVGFVRQKLSLRVAAGLSLALGLLVGSLAFQQAQLVLCVAMGVVALFAAPLTRGRSIVLAASLGAGVLILVPAWLPLVRNLDQYTSARNVLCIAATGVGWDDFVKSVLSPSLSIHRFTFVSAVAIGLLPFTPAPLRFLAFGLAAIGAWEIFGVPEPACKLPVFSGMRFVRHFLPHLQMLCIVTVGITAAALSQQLHRKRTWIILALAQVVAWYVLEGAPAGGPLKWAVRACLLANSLALVAAALYASELRELSEGRRLSSALFAPSLAFAALIPLIFASGMPHVVLDSAIGSPQAPPIADKIDRESAIGMVQKLSQQEDRRHISPGALLYPNWPEAFGILDALSLNAFFPIGYHELNAGLFHFWERDPQHGLNPDRFVPVQGRAAMTVDFQRVMAVHRVSLLSFRLNQAIFANSPSPYARDKCPLLARSPVQGAESYVCPEVGGVGFFPRVVGVVHSRSEAVQQLRRLPVSEVVDTVLLGPEIDLSIGQERATEVVPAEGRVVSFRRRSDKLTYTLDVTRPGVFAITDTYFRGWTARVNGKPAGISRSNVAFKAVRVPAGRVVVTLRFKPVMF